MTEVASLSKESIKTLGPGAYLVTVLPGVVLALTVFGLISSRLYPWSEPLMRNGQPLHSGIDSVVASATNLGAVGSVILFISILVVAVVLRPLQLSLVQVLEGYWQPRGAQSVLAFALERQQRRRTILEHRRNPGGTTSQVCTFASVAKSARRQYLVDRMSKRATDSLDEYPPDPRHTMPTRLGNMLRCAEVSSGERYGLSTVAVYPRLSPHLSPELGGEMARQLDVLDTTATFSPLFLFQCLLTCPLLLRLDAWSGLPVAFLMIAWLSYRGAILAAGRQGILLATAFDLHRFDMLASMHRPMPADAAQELKDNMQLSTFLQQSHPLQQELQGEWTYQHPGLDNQFAQRATSVGPIGRRARRDHQRRPRE